MVDAVDDGLEQIASVFERNQIESRLERAAASASLLEGVEVGPEGGALARNGASEVLTHGPLTPRGP